MKKEKLISFYCSHKGEVIGAAIGLVVAIMILILGFFKFLFIVICMSLGYYIGKVITGDKDYLKKLFDKIFPPGTIR